jgi:hypothetical protein
MDVVHVTSTAYIVNLTSSSTELPNETFGAQVKVEKSGTVDWDYTKISGFADNLTGFEATDVFEGDMAFFELESGTNQVYNYALLTQYFHQVGGTNTLFLVNAGTGQNTAVDYQTYVPNSANETFGYCGSNISFTQFSVEIGTIRNSNVQVLAAFTVKGTVNGTPEDSTLTLAWVWLESS